MDLIHGVVEIVRTTGALFVHEAQHAARLVRSRLVTVVVALSVLVTGMALVVTAVALWVGAVMGEAWMGFAIVGGAAVLLGGAVVTFAARSLATRRDLGFPATRGQIGRDLEWLDQHLGADAKKNSNA